MFTFARLTQLVRNNPYHSIWLALLLALTILLRIYPIFPHNFPYLYDHAKDTLVMYEMGVYKDPSLVGPTTSIPGVFYGPVWYYIASPLNFITNYHPFASVFTVVLISLLSVIILWKFESKFAAILYSTSVGMISLQQSAWTPYMTPFFTLPATLILSKIIKQKKISSLQAVMLAVSCGGLFHVQVAYAIVFLPIVLFIWIWRIGLTKQLPKLAAFFLVLGLTLTPSLIFELKHDFLQTKAVIQFIKDYRTQSKIVGDNQSGFAKIPEIFRYTYNSLLISVTPKVTNVLPLGIPFVLFLIWQLKKKEFMTEKILVTSIIGGTFLLYLLLPAKPYYFVAIYPIVLVVFSRIITTSFPSVKKQFVVFLVVMAIYNMIDSRSVYEGIAQEKAILYAPKLSAVNQVYAMSEGQPFASYHFLPEVYDYVYQVIYLRKQLLGEKVPTEFSYAQGEYTYIPQKREFLPTGEPEFIFLIVENYKYSDVFQSWWDRVAKDLEIIEEVQVNQAIRIYKTRKVIVK